MTVGRWVLLATFIVAASLAAALAFVSSGTASLVEGAVSALAGVTATGVAIWAALPRRSGQGGHVSIARRTGPATAEGAGSRAVSGVSGANGGTAEHTGSAKATGGGSANSGVDDVGS
jgi:hypothetical protein